MADFFSQVWKSSGASGKDSHSRSLIIVSFANSQTRRVRGISQTGDLHQIDPLSQQSTRSLSPFLPSLLDARGPRKWRPRRRRCTVAQCPANDPRCSYLLRTFLPRNCERWMIDVGAASWNRARPIVFSTRCAMSPPLLSWNESVKFHSFFS